MAIKLPDYESGVCQIEAVGICNGAVERDVCCATKEFYERRTRVVGCGHGFLVADENLGLDALPRSTRSLSNNNSPIKA